MSKFSKALSKGGTERGGEEEIPVGLDEILEMGEKYDKPLMKPSRVFDLKVLADELYKLFNRSEFDQDVKEHLKIAELKEIKILNQTYNRFMTSQVQYYFTEKWGGKSDKILSYDDGTRCAPFYTTIFDRNEKAIVCVEDGYIFFLKPFRFLIHLDSGPNSIKIRMIYKDENNKAAEKLFEEMLREIDSAGFYKGAIVSITEKFVQFMYNIKANELFLKKNVVDELTLNLEFPMKNRDRLQKAGLPWRRGVLLFGYPGTGKTQISKKLALEATKIGFTVIWVTARSIDHPQEVAHLFKFARTCAPSLIVFEDIDLFAGARDTDGYGNHPNIFGEFLQQMDGISTNDGIFSVATTNRPYALDKAVSDRPMRFDAKIELDYNDMESKIALINLFNTAKLPIDPKQIAYSLDKVTPAHVQELLIKSTLLSIQRETPFGNEDVISLWTQMRPNMSGTEVA